MNICFRLKPGDDLKQKIEGFAIRKKISGIVASGVGSLNKLKIRLADSKTILEKEEAYEIVSLNGTLSPDGVHLHISVADAKGAVTGGHLKDGCIIDTTCEVVIISFDDIKFSRVYDKSTGYEELNVESVL